MSAPAHLKCRCQHCQGSIEFPVEGVGTSAACPHCGEETELRLPEADDADRAVERTRAWAIGGVIVLVLLLIAAFVAVHLLQKIAPRVRRARGVSSSLPAKPAAVQSTFILAGTTAADNASLTSAWLRTNGFVLSSIGGARETV